MLVKGVEFSTVTNRPCKSVEKVGKDVENFSNLAKSKQSDTIYDIMPKRTYQPKKARRAKVHGFRARMSTKVGQTVLKRRRNKGRAKIAV